MRWGRGPIPAARRLRNRGGYCGLDLGRKVFDRLLGGCQRRRIEDCSGVIAFAATSAYRPRACYDGIAEVSVYVDRASRKRGAGRLALSELIRVCEEAGFWKLVSRIFPENKGSRALIASLGFREVGVYEKHGRLDGVWRDVIIVERLIEVNLS